MTKLAEIYVLDYIVERPEVELVAAIHDALNLVTPGNVRFIPEKSKIGKDGTILSAYYEPDEEALYYLAPVVLLMERAETEMFNYQLQGRAQATPAPYWAKAGLEIDGETLLRDYGHLIDSKHKLGRAPAILAGI